MHQQDRQEHWGYGDARIHGEGRDGLTVDVYDAFRTEKIVCVGAALCQAQMKKWWRVSAEELPLACSLKDELLEVGCPVDSEGPYDLICGLHVPIIILRFKVLLKGGFNLRAEEW